MSRKPGPHSLFTTYVHLRQDSAATPIPVSARFWTDLTQGQLPELDTGRLVTAFSFDSPWDSWERHPEGEEVVILLSGNIRFILERDGADDVIELSTPGAFLLVPRGVWHRADTSEPSSALFITPGRGTEHRPLA